MADSSWGGPGVAASDLTRITNIPGAALNVRKEVAPIFQYLVNELHKPGYRVSGAPPLSSSGGYNKRFIAGTTTWSNHSWGLAVDINAATNPYSYTLKSDFVPAKVKPLADFLGLRWGYYYKNKKDPMHFEFLGSRSDAAAIVAKLPAGSFDPGTASASLNSQVFGSVLKGDFSVFTDQKLWIRIAMLGAGIVLTNIGVWRLTGINPVSSGAGIIEAVQKYGSKNE